VLLPYLNNWLYFAIVFGLFLVISFIMIKISGRFYTKDVVVRRFSIMELQVPATPTELVNLISGLYLLPPAQSAKAIGALKAHLKIDFLIMPLAYGSIFLLNWKVAHKMEHPLGQYVFMAFAFLQFIAWLCDIIENIYLLGKIQPEPVKTDVKTHRNYLRMEATKWTICLTGLVCAVSAIFYFWLSGKYNPVSFNYLLVVFGEIVIFLVAVKISSKGKKKNA
jgi:hypothetical protein